MTDQLFNDPNTLIEDASDLLSITDSLTADGLADPLNLNQERVYDSSSPEVMKVQLSENNINISQPLTISLDTSTSSSLSNLEEFKNPPNRSLQALTSRSITVEPNSSLSQSLPIKPIATQTITGPVNVQTPIIPELQGLTEGQDFAAQQVIIKFKSNIQIAQVQTLQSTLGATTLKAAAITGAQLWDVGDRSIADAILALKDNPLVEYIEPNYHLSITGTATSAHSTTTPNDPDYDQLWGLNNTGQTGGSVDADIDAPEAWEIAQGDDVIVGVIDTGIDYTHPDLYNNLWTNPGEIANDGIDNDGNGYVDDYYGYDFINNDSDPFDDVGHGTHVAGTIAAQSNNNTGVVGVAPNAKVMALKFLGNFGGSTFDAIEAINYAVMMGADITNNSWGGGGPSQALYDAIANAGSAGQLFVASAGNGGSDSLGDNNDFLPSYPASYDLDNIISVAASDHQDQLSSFSNYGLESVDLAAPGVDIVSTVPGGYDSFNGTSMAAPHVTGAASLLLSQNPDLTPTQLKDQLLSTVDPVAELQGLTVSGGRLNAHQALIGNGSETKNYSFESGDFTDWETYGDANVITSGIGISPTDGSFQAQITNGDGALSVAQLEALLELDQDLLSSANSGNLREGSAIQLTPITVEAGDVLLFDFNFLTNESTPDPDNNDFAFVTFNNDYVWNLGDTSTLAQEFDPLVFNTQTGYLTAGFEFTGAGTYTIAIGVMDEGDAGVDSSVLIDNVQLLSANEQSQILQSQTLDPLLAGGLQSSSVEGTAPGLDLAAEHPAINVIQPHVFSTTDWSLGQASEYGLGQNSLIGEGEPTIIAIEEPLIIGG